MTDGDLRQLVAAKLAAVERRDWYALLDIGTAATADDVRRAYHELIKLLHPDRLRRRDLGNLDGAGVFKALTDAYQVLSSPDSRKRYDLERVSGGARGPAARPSMTARGPAPKGDPQVPKGVTEKDLLEAPVERFTPAERTEIARWLMQAGAGLFAKAEYDTAERYFRRCIDLDPTRPVYSLRLGWAIFRNAARSSDDRREAARPHLESAGARDAYNPEARYALAQFLREFGAPESYRRELHAVLRCDENHLRARQELETLEATLTEVQDRNERLRNRPGANGASGTLGFTRPENRPTGIRNRLRGLFGRPDQPDA